VYVHAPLFVQAKPDALLEGCAEFPTAVGEFGLGLGMQSDALVDDCVHVGDEWARFGLRTRARSSAGWSAFGRTRPERLERRLTGPSEGS